MTFRKPISTLFICIALLSFISPLRSQVRIDDVPGKIDYASPKEYIIGGITISGVKYLDNSALLLLSGLSTGDKIKIPGDEISQAINNLWNQGLFENISITAAQIEGDVIYLNIDLMERPRMSVFSFKGIKGGEADNIRDEIKLTSGDVVTENLLVRTKNTIIKYFADKGFLDARVTIHQLQDTSRANLVQLLIEIDKNKRVKIGSISMTGNKMLSSDKLKRAMKETKEIGNFRPTRDLEKFIFDMARFSLALRFDSVKQEIRSFLNENYKFRIFKSSKYIADTYEEDKDNLIKKYLAQGFRDAKIVRDSVYRDDKNRVRIDIDFTEGNRYYFRRITFIGNTKYTADQLRSKLRIEKGDIYNWELLNANLTFNENEDDVSSLYMNDGYLFFAADPVEVLVENDSIDLEIRIHEGKQATINRIGIKGNTRTNDKVIVREMYSKPGELFSRSDIIRTTRELAQLNYFNAEKINPQVEPNPAEGTVDLGWELEETSSDQVELSGGWGYGRVLGTLGVSFNNFSAKNLFKGESWRPVPTGDGQKLSLRLQSYGKGYISYNASFTEPWLGGRKPNSFSVSYYHSLYSNGLPRSDANRQTFRINGISVGLGKRLTWPDDFFQLFQNINLQLYDLKNYGTYYSFGSGTGYFNNFSYDIMLQRHSLDQLIYPRTGSIVSLSMKLTPPYSLFSGIDYDNVTETEKYKWIEYHKWIIANTWISRLAGNLVLMARTKHGFLGYYNSKIGVTPFERFYLGGDGLSGYSVLDGRDIIGMRGYGNEALTPDYYLTRNSGGTIYEKYTLELRYPLSLNPSATIYMLSFLEAGNAWKKFRKFNPFDVKRSAGIGVRVFLPMFGVLGLDWGYGFDEVTGLPDANRGQFHFSINQSID